MKGSRGCKKEKQKAPIKSKKEKQKADKATTRQVEDSSQGDSTDSEEANKVTEVNQVRAMKQEHTKQAKVGSTPIDHGVEGAQAMVQLLVDSVVYKTLLSEKDWKGVKINRTKFRPFGTNYSLPILGRTKCRLKAICGQEVRTLVYVVAGETESLLGLKDAQALGIVTINLEGQQITETEDLRQLYDMPRQVLGPGIISRGQTQQEIDLQMTELVKPFQQVFQGIGAAKVEPVHIEVDKTVKPV